MKIKLFLITIIFTLLFETLAYSAPVKVRIATHVSIFSPLHEQNMMFIREIEKRLPGQFEFSLFTSGELGKEKALIANVKAGTVEMVNIASGVLKLDKKLGVFDLPWLFDDREHVRRAMGGSLGQQVKARIEEKADVKVIGIYENGFRHVLNSVRPINKPADLKDMKVRVSGGKFRQNVFSQIGATPQTVAWKEAFTALQTKNVDGVEAATYGFYEQKQYEVAGYMSKTGHVYTPSFLLSSKKLWESLTEEQRKVFNDVGQEITSEAYGRAKDLEDKYLKDMSYLVSINNVNLTSFQDSTKDSYTSYIKTQGKEWIELINSVRKK